MLRYLEIKNQLREMVEEMSVGTKLPARTILSRKMDTTRATLDKAIGELESEGYLVSKKGSGTYVSCIPNEKPTALIENWGVIVPNIMDPIYPGLVRGIENVAQRYGLSISLCNSDDSSEKQEMYIRRLILLGVSGFIIVPVIPNSLDETCRLYRQLSGSRLPFIFCNRSVDGIEAPVITSNSYYGGYIATKHLIEKGYRRIAYVAKRKYSTSMERCSGCISALLENGLEVHGALMILHADSTGERTLFKRMYDMLLTGERPDAIFCFNDEVARTAYEAIKKAGLSVSDDVGIIGYDDESSCCLYTPQITSVSYKHVEIGERAGELLYKMVNGQPAPEFSYFFLQPEIVERESCLGPKTR